MDISILVLSRFPTISKIILTLTEFFTLIQGILMNVRIVIIVSFFEISN